MLSRNGKLHQLHVDQPVTHQSRNQFSMSLVAIILESTKHQKHLGDKIRKLKSNQHLQDLLISNAREDAARFRSLQGKGARSWVEAIPASNKFALGPNEFHLAVCLKMGLSLEFPPWIG